LFEDRCICDLMPSLPTRTRLMLVLHYFEARKPTNTGQLATACLPNSEVVIRGREGHPPPSFDFPAGTQPLYLFPHEGAVPLTDYADHDKPIVLVVPDGTWRQAWKVRKREPALANVPCVSLPEGGALTRYRLRVERREGGLATIEAIARAFEVLEGPAVREALDGIFELMVERSLRQRGSPLATPE
jgi:DTW domain-containing protein YfiP